MMLATGALDASASVIYCVSTETVKECVHIAQSQYSCILYTTSSFILSDDTQIEMFLRLLSEVILSLSHLLVK